MAVSANLPPVSRLLMGRETAPSSSFLILKLFGSCNFKEFELFTGMSSEMLETFSEVWDALGGRQGLTGLTGAKTSTLSMWKKAESFPSNTYVAMTDALRAVGKTAPASLWGMKASSEVAS
jgi:hypothetical protein